MYFDNLYRLYLDDYFSQRIINKNVTTLSNQIRYNG